MAAPRRTRICPQARCPCGPPPRRPKAASYRPGATSPLQATPAAADCPAACAPACRAPASRAPRALLLEVDALEHAPSLALWEALEVVVVRRNLHEPLGAHVRDHADKVFRGEHKLIVDAKLGAVREARGRVQGHHLVVLDREVVARALQVRHLHEEAREHRLADLHVVLLVVKVVGLELEAKAVHDAHQLGPHRVGRLHGAAVEEVVVAPGRGLLVVLPGVVHVEQGEVVPVHVVEARLGVVRRLLGLARAHEGVRPREHGHDGEHLVGAAQLGAVQEHLGHLRVHGELGHHGAELREVAVVVQGPERVPGLERAHQRLRGRRVHEVEVHEVVDAELLELEHHGGEVGAQDLGVSLVDELLLEGPLRVEAEALAGARAARAARALVRGGLGDGRHEE
mmetsp:Transcript_5353/g.18121  ORF Transcript_5353/g.18121 Transcript_5353/m.18121 type:complete len:398 (-) Transcript_5353:100-1293(-)